MHDDPYYRAEIPDHIPPALVHDFNMYTLAADDRDPFIAIHDLYKRNLPDIFWTRHNGGHWVAVNSKAIADAMHDSTNFSSLRPFVPDQYNAGMTLFVPLMADPPEHADYRAIVQPLFSPARIAALETKIRTFTGELIDGIRPRGECEFMSDFALQMPIAVFLQLLDLPLTDRVKLLEVVRRFTRSRDAELRKAGLHELFDYLRPVVADRHGKKGEDVVSKLVNGLYQGRPLVPDEQLGLTATVFVGGMASVASTLGFVADYLAAHPEARSFLAERPDKITAAADEFMRRFAVAIVGRQVTKDITFYGSPLRKGDHIVLMGALQNLDDQEFPDSLKVDFDRKRGRHGTFGNGIHFCLGALLARLELRVFLTEWLRRIPDFHIKRGSPCRYQMGTIMGVTELHLSWPAA
jgi:camphor 5-monooxygenase